MISYAAVAARLSPYLGKVAGVLAVVVFVGAVGLGGYLKGVSNTKAKYEAQAASYYEKEKVLRERELALNASEAGKVARATAQLETRIEKGVRKLNDAIEKAGTNPSCDLTADELEAFTSIGDSGS